jgi:hypothetical protein
VRYIKKHSGSSAYKTSPRSSWWAWRPSDSSPRLHPSTRLPCSHGACLQVQESRAATRFHGPGCEPGPTYFHHHLDDGCSPSTHSTLAKSILDLLCMQLRTFLSHAYIYGSIMFIYFIFYSEKFFGCTQLISLFLLRNLVDLLHQQKKCSSVCTDYGY